MHGDLGDLGDLLGDGDDVLVVREQDHLGAARGAHRVEQLGGRRVHRLTARDEPADPEGAEDAPDAVALDDRDDGGPRRRARVVATGEGERALADPALLDHLLGEVGDPDPARATHVEGRLDRGADVVGVDVAVVEAVAADDDDRVADPRPDVLEPRRPRRRVPRGST